MTRALPPRTPAIRRLAPILAGALLLLGACAAGPDAPPRPSGGAFSPCVDPFSGYVSRECR